MYDLRFEISNLKLPAVISGKSTSNLTTFMQNKANRRPLAGNPKLEILSSKQYQMFKILNFQNKIVEKLLVFRSSAIRNTQYDIRDTIQLCKTKPIW